MGALGQHRALAVVVDWDFKIPSDLDGVVFPFKSSETTMSEFASTIIAHMEKENSNRKNHKLVNAIQKLHEHHFIEEVSSLIIDTSGTKSIEQFPFIYEMRLQCKAWADKAMQWANGELRVEKSYDSFIRQIYRSARLSIYSTTVSKFMSYWKKSSGRELLRAQAANTAIKSSRVFIFDNENSLIDEYREICAEHAENGITVRILFWNSEKVRNNSVLRDCRFNDMDWTIIDNGEIIGATKYFAIEKQEDLVAIWYINNTAEKEKYTNLWKEIMDTSIEWNKLQR